MAYSSSIKRAQAIKFCDFCKKNSLKWRCIDCDKCLCDKCKISHLRVAVTAKHQIVTIGTPLQNVPKKIVTDNIPCKDHPRKMASLFCRSCDSLVCPSCVSSSHKKHKVNFDSIESVLEEKLDNLRGMRDKIDVNLKRCESKTLEINQLKPKYNAVFDESVTNIKQREQELIDVIRKHSKVLQEKVEKERSQVNSDLSKIQQNVDNTKKNQDERRKELDAILSSSQGSVIFKANMQIKDVKFDSLPIQVEKLNTEKESSKTIKEFFGSFQTLTISSTHVPPEIDFEVLKIFTTDLIKIYQVKTLDKASAWIMCWDLLNGEVQNMMRKVNIEDNTMITSQEVNLEFVDMAVTLNKELLLSGRVKMMEISGEMEVVRFKDVELMKSSGEIVTFLTVAPLFPRGIHVTKNTDIIVGVTDDIDTDTPTETSQIALIVFDMSGKEKRRYQYYNDGQILFTLPERITTNNNQDILVVDYNHSHGTGKVVALNKGGGLKWLYEGHPKINDGTQFDPRDIVTTSEGLVIVSDWRSHALHVLSGDGNVLTCKVVRDMGIMSPFGLDIDNEGRLWVGCETDDEQAGAIIIIKIIA